MVKNVTGTNLINGEKINGVLELGKYGAAVIEL